jgi:hypothetical protein
LRRGARADVAGMRRCAAILMALPLLAGCGSQQSHLGEYGTQIATTPPTGDAEYLAGMTLDASDLGGSWRPDDANTHQVTADEAMQHAPGRIQIVDLQSYWAGFQTRSIRGKLSLVSTVSLYRDPGAAATVAAERMLRPAGATPVRLHVGSPGESFVIWRGGSGAHQYYTATWAHSIVLVTTVLSGSGASPSRLVALAREQDRKVTERLAAALAASTSH